MLRQESSLHESLFVLSIVRYPKTVKEQVRNMQSRTHLMRNRARKSWMQRYPYGTGVDLVTESDPVSWWLTFTGDHFSSQQRTSHDALNLMYIVVERNSLVDGTC